MKLTPLFLVFSLCACSSDDRSVGNGPGHADGWGGREDPPSASEPESTEPKVVAQADQQRTRERPDASSAEEPTRTRPNVPAGADSSSQPSIPEASTKSSTNPLAKSDSAATKIVQDPKKTAEDGAQDRKQSSSAPPKQQTR